MDIVAISRALLLLAVANGAPVLAKNLLGNFLARPVDGGALFLDGRPLFGASKTLRGVALSLLATAIFAPFVGCARATGVMIAAAAMAGDLFSSFIKRRLARPVSSQALGLDQVPESLLPLLASRSELSLSALDIAVGVAAFLVLELFLSRILFVLHLRDRPY